MKFNLELSVFISSHSKTIPHNAGFEKIWQLLRKEIEITCINKRNVERDTNGNQLHPCREPFRNVATSNAATLKTPVLKANHQYCFTC